MFKKIFLPFLVFLLFIIGLYVFIEKPYLPKIPNTNIFSEMYFQEKDGILSKLGSSKYGAKLYATRDGDGLHHSYDYKIKDEAVNEVGVLVTKKGKDADGIIYDGSVFITISEPIDGGEIIAKFYYEANSTRLTRTIVYSPNDEEQNLSTEEAVQKTGKSIEYYANIATSYLKNKVLKDWTRVYNSKYSPDNWGDVKVEDWTVEK